MAEIHMRRKHSIGVRKAKVAAQKVADDLAEEFGIESEWDSHVLRFSRHGVDGALTVAKDEVVLTAKLGFVLTVFKTKIEDHINDRFDKYFT